jgi:putative ABC transport system substrate-binding protein
MNRREAALTLLALVAAGGAFAQQVKRTARIGVSMMTPPDNPFIGPLREGLRDLGWIEGRNLRLEIRYAEGQVQRLRDFMAEFVRLKVDVIVAGGGTVAARAAMQQATAIPIVVPVAVDPVGTGLVASLAKPGGNVTGMSMLAPAISAKRVEIIKELAPNAKRLAILLDPAVDAGQVPATVGAARALGLQFHIVTASRTEEFRDAFEAATKGGADAMVILSSSFFNSHRKSLVELSERFRIPAIYEHSEFVAAGGLISYGPSLPDMYRRAATFVDKILKGAHPGDLPVEQPTKFELMINLRTAKALGMTVPKAAILRADGVIE